MIRTIKSCPCGNRCEGATEFCASCNASIRKAERKTEAKAFRSIRQFSDERTRMEHKYKRARKRFLQGKKCAAKFPHNCTIEYNLTVHHMQGRVGYADEWARENDVPLLIDERFFLPLCSESHQYINDHPLFAFENQYSFKRITDPIFIKK